MIRIKGYEFRQIKINDSYNRRALQYQNKILNQLRPFGLTEDDIEVPLEKVSIKKAQASVSWYMFGEHLFFSYNGSAKFVENLAMVTQVIEFFTNLLKEKKITEEELLNEFTEDIDIINIRKNAREVLSVEEDSTDFELIHQNYKKLSKEHHPDMPNGNTEQFKKINNAHKILKKELNL